MLRECIDSLQAVQLAHDEREIIVVDDGSDATVTKSLLANLNPAVRVMTKEHEGVSVARNAGLSQAKGEYVQFVDADDTLLPDRYNRCLTGLRRLRPDVLVLRYVERQTGSCPAFRSNMYETGAQYMLRNNVHGGCWNYIVRSDVARQTTFPAGIKFAEDERWTAQMLLRASTTIDTRMPAYCYRRHAASATGNKSEKVAEQKINDAFSTLVYLNNLCPTLDGVPRAALRRRVAQLTMDYLYNLLHQSPTADTLDRRIAQLRQAHLFPLPKKNYTTKYTLFRWCIQNRALRWLMGVMAS